jgi:hypothetical protein
LTFFIHFKVKFSTKLPSPFPTIPANSFPHFYNQLNYENLKKTFHFSTKTVTVHNKCLEKRFDLIVNELRRLLIYCGISFTILLNGEKRQVRQADCCLQKNSHLDSVHCLTFILSIYPFFCCTRTAHAIDN